MNYPPLLMHLRTANNGRRVGLWLPLFLLWLVVMPIVIALAPLVLIATVILWPFGLGKPFLLIGPAIFRCICNLSGLEIDVKSGQQLLLMSFK